MSEAVATTGILVKRQPGTLPAAKTITSSSVANPTVILTSTPHGLNTGDVVTIAGHTGSTPALDGSYTVTKIDATHFSVPLNVTVAGSGGTVQQNFETIGEITKVTPPGFSRNKIPTSTHNEGSESNVLGILLQRDASFTINYVSSNTTHQDILNDILNNVKNTWQIAFPSGILFTAMARVQQFMLGDAPLDAAQTADVTITWAERVTVTTPS